MFALKVQYWKGQLEKLSFSEKDSIVEIANPLLTPLYQVPWLSSNIIPLVSRGLRPLDFRI
jgi:cell pole-organizing protein PopZ